MSQAAYEHNGLPVTAGRFYAIACDPARSVAVEACAGAGKTWMLVSRILRALVEGATGKEILAITFTRTSAALNDYGGGQLSWSDGQRTARIPVVVRFSVGGANPKAPDNAKSQRNMALQFNLPNGEIWQMGNISSPVFGAATPQQFIGLLASRQPDPVTKQPDPAKVKAFIDFLTNVVQDIESQQAQV